MPRGNGRFDGESPSLGRDDFEMFARLRIPPALLVEARVQRVSDKEARNDYGMQFAAMADLRGIIFPYYIPPVDYRVGARVRRDHPEVDIDGKIRNKYISAYGDRKHLYFPPGAKAKLDDPNLIIVLVEAEKSSLALTAWAGRVGVPLLALAMGGCWGWRSQRASSRVALNGAREPVPGPISDLDYCDGHKVFVLLDSNVATNEDVQQSRSALIRELSKRERKCTVMICDLPLIPGVNGPDDLLAVLDDAAMTAVFHQAHAANKSTGQQPRSRSTDEPPERALDIVTLSAIASRQPEWLWQLYLALGTITLLSGDPSAGKSWIALAIAASLSLGILLDGRTVEPQSCLYLTTENPLAEVLRGRFDSLGGDASRLHVLRGFNLRYADGREEHSSITLSDVEMLDEAILKYKPVLVVIDPIQSYLGATVDFHRANETRPVLDGLIRLTEKYHLATLIIRHLSKGIGGKALYRGMGTIDMTAAARSEILAGQLPNDPDSRALVHAKAFTTTGPSLGYRIANDGMHGKFEWTGVTNITANDLLAAPIQPKKIELAKEFLKTTLAKGSMEQEKLFAKAEDEGISGKTLRRAKTILQVKSTRKTFKGRVLWEFPQPESAPNGKGDAPHDK